MLEIMPAWCIIGMSPHSKMDSTHKNELLTCRQQYTSYMIIFWTDFSLPASHILKGYVTCWMVTKMTIIYSNLGLKQCWYFKSNNTGFQFLRHFSLITKKFKISEYSIWTSTPSPTVYSRLSCIFQNVLWLHEDLHISRIKLNIYDNHQNHANPPPPPKKKETFRQWSAVTKYATHLFKVWGWMSYYRLHLFMGILLKYNLPYFANHF